MNLVERPARAMRQETGSFKPIISISAQGDNFRELYRFDLQIFVDAGSTKIKLLPDAEKRQPSFAVVG